MNNILPKTKLGWTGLVIAFILLMLSNIALALTPLWYYIDNGLVGNELPFGLSFIGTFIAIGGIKIGNADK